MSGLSFLGRVFPLSVAIVGLVATIPVLLPQLLGRRTNSVVFHGEAQRREGDGPIGPFGYIAMLVAFIGAIGLLGYFLALLVFVVFLSPGGEGGMAACCGSDAGGRGLLLTLAASLNMTLPEGLLQTHYH